MPTQQTYRVPQEFKRRPNREKRSSRRIRAVLTALGQAGISAGLLGLCGSTLAASGSWDCRVADDGRGWACNKNGVPEERPAETAPAIAPALTPAAADAEPPEPEVPARPVAREPEKPATEAIPSPTGIRTIAPVADVTEDKAPSVDPAPAPATRTTAATAEISPDPRFEVSTPADIATQPEAETVAPQAAAPAADTAPDAPQTGSTSSHAGTLAETAPETDPETAPETTPETDPETQSHPLIDDDLDWNRCVRDEGIDLGPVVLQTGQQDIAAIEVTADSAETNTLERTARFSGSVELQQGPQRIFADQLEYAQDSGNLNASGMVLLQRPDLRLAASEVDYNLQTRSGHASNAEYRLPGIMARGTAEKAEFTDQAHSSYEDITYTTCAPGNSDWLLSAERLEVDRTEGRGTAHNAKLSFLGAPLAWVPKLTFPIDGRRHSGLLIPTLGYSDKRGVDITVPYYLNLAPNYDLTLSPRIMSKRGFMLGSEFRFLTSHTEGVIGADYLPNDRDNPEERRRGALSVQTLSRFNPNLSAAIRVNHVSDEVFLRDFGGSLEVTSTSHLERAAELRYDTEAWNALARVQNYQTIDDLLPKADRPYARLPQLAFNLYRQPLNHLLGYELDAEFTRFAKDGGFVEGTRLDLQPGVSLPLREAHYHLVPRASLRYTKYNLDNATGPDSSPDRLSPIFSLDGGLYYDRSTQLFGNAVTQTLEPRIHYLYVPKHGQDEIPVFDTDEYDFSFDNLFRENRFNGADRLGDANQLTLALTTRFNHQATGREILRANLGSILYFRDREVQLPGIPVDDDQSSALVAELAADFGNGWHTRGGLNWDPHDNEIDQALAQASYRNREGNIINLAYRLRDDINTHTDVGLIWPISNNTRMIGRWNYSLSEERNLETLGGVEYGRCCWKIRALVRQHSAGTGGDDDLGFLLQLELGGLGSFGDNIDSLLNDGIYGYRREND